MSTRSRRRRELPGLLDHADVQTRRGHGACHARRAARPPRLVDGVRLLQVVARGVVAQEPRITITSLEAAARHLGRRAQAGTAEELAETGAARLVEVEEKNGGLWSARGGRRGEEDDFEHGASLASGRPAPPRLGLFSWPRPSPRCARPTTCRSTAAAAASTSGSCSTRATSRPSKSARPPKPSTRRATPRSRSSRAAPRSTRTGAPAAARTRRATRRRRP
mmetsp:Transcript_1248/g.3456  ORF Transcript_1248/g.3456 Transcript_1248/m.3456 type:complete len:221 (+) Transcript_1248:559-1221(+)